MTNQTRAAYVRVTRRSATEGPVAHTAPPWNRRACAAKRTLDLAVSVVGLVLLAPVFVAVAAAIRISSPGPALLRQRRVGAGGAVFAMAKFRTMVTTAEPDGLPVWSCDDDDRVTVVGRFLRASHLDELPQLWNVVVGEMSLVGPRPERPEISAELSIAIPQWQRRHDVKPGITGWAQLRSGYAASVAQSRTKLSHDLYYLEHQCLRLDLQILAETLGLNRHRRG